MRHLKTLSRFSPANCEPALLERVLVGRGDLADRLERAVIESAESGAGLHQLIVGPRGAGKTHLLAIVHNRVASNDDLAGRVVVAYMKEEERGVASFLDFLVRILRAINRRGPSKGQFDGPLRELTRMSLDRARGEAQRMLVKHVGDRRLVLIVENLGMLFSKRKGMGPAGQKRLRDLIQQHPFWTVLASAQALFPDIQSGQAPFYGFFKVHHLPMFDFEQSMELLCRLAKNDARHKLRAFLGSSEGRGRVRAIHELTGGNPRLLVVFYQFVDSNAISELSAAFLEMADSLTAYYQEQMQPLPALQQKIVEFLCEYRAAAQVKEIARSCFVSEQSASKQLKLLADSRYLRVTRSGRKSFYELREPMFRICFEIKQNLGYPVTLFLEFLGRFYSFEELERKVRGADLLRQLHEQGGDDSLVGDDEVEISYLRETLTRYHASSANDALGEALHLPNLKGALTELIEGKEYRYAYRVANAASELGLERPYMAVAAARSLRELGDLPTALERVEAALCEDGRSADAWCEKARVLDALGKFAEASSCLDAALECEPDHAEALAWRARAWLNDGDGPRAIEAAGRALELEPTKVTAQRILGLAQCKAGDTEVGLSTLRRAVEQSPTDGVVRASLALAELEWGDKDAALQHAKCGRTLSPDKGLSWMNIGQVFEQNGLPLDALTCFTMGTELDPTHSGFWRVRANGELRMHDLVSAEHSVLQAIGSGGEVVSDWFMLASIRRVLDNKGGEGEALVRAAEFIGDEPELWRGLANRFYALDDKRSAVAACQRFVALEPDDADMWNNLGVVSSEMGDYLASRDAYRKLVELRPESAYTWKGLGFAQLHVGSLHAALESLRCGLPSFGDTVPLYQFLGILEGLLGDDARGKELLRQAFDRGARDHAKVLLYVGAHTTDHRSRLQLALKAIEHDPAESTAWPMAVQAALQMESPDLGMLQELLSKVEAHVEQHPDDHPRWLDLGRLRSVTDDDDGAQDAYMRALTLAPEVAEYRAEYAKRLLEFGSHAEAISFIEHELETHPRDSALWKLLAAAKLAIDGSMAEVQVLERAVDVVPDHGGLWTTLALAHRRAGDKTEATSCAHRGVELAPDEHPSWWVLVWCLKDEHKHVEALAAVQQALELRPNDLMLRSLSAGFALAGGDSERARREANAIYELVTDEPYALTFLGETFRLLGDFDQAIELYERAVDAQPSACIPRMNLAFVAYQTGRIGDALNQVRRTLEFGEQHDWADELTVCAKELTVELALHSPLEGLPALLRDLEAAYTDGGRQEAFITGFVGAWAELIERHEELALARLEGLAEHVARPLLERAELAQAAQLFCAAARYLASHDIEVLLELPLEQRRRLQALLGLQP